jgi:hypothetical protein
VIPLSGGRLWPPAISRRCPRLSSVSIVTPAALAVAGGEEAGSDRAGGAS